MLVFITININAQSGKMKVEPSIVLATSHTGTSMGFGANGTFFYGINDKIDVTGSLGYITWSYSDWDGSYSTIPLLGGARYSFGDKSGFTPYASAEIGLHFVSLSFPTFSYFGESSSTSSISETNFGIGIGGGAYYKLGDLTIDGNLQYNSMDSGYFTLKVGAIFEL